MTTPLNRTFLSYARQGLAGQITAPAGVTSAPPPRADIAIKIAVNNRAPVGLDLQTYGPGDVIGFDEGQIVRTEPAVGTSNFEPDLLACVEFARPDLPWLLTPAAPDPATGRIRPWLALVVVTQQNSTITATPGVPLPMLSCPLAELPDLAESWAWAHAQVTGAPGASVDSLLGTPGAALSRLICPRHLAPATGYYACIVPAFAAGVLAGLGQPAPAGNLSPAWSAGSPVTVQLPIYYHWAFATGPSGDFATLASQLRPRIISAELGLRGMDISAADPEIPAPDPADSVLGMSGAAGGGAPADTVPAGFQAALAAVLAGGATGVGPPVYGGFQAGTGTALPPAGSPPRWLSDLNLDPRRRAAAGLGTQVVQAAQEQLMASAWAQAAQIGQANQLLRGGQLARSVSSAWYRKHIQQTVASPDASATDQLVQLTGPAHDRILAPGTGLTVSGQLSASAAVAATISTAYRQVARPLGPVARRLGATPAAPLPPPITAITSGSLVATPPRPAPGGLVTVDGAITPSSTTRPQPGMPGPIPPTYGTITPQLVEGAPSWWQGPAGGFAAVPDGFWSDLVAFRATGTGLGWRVGQHLDFTGSIADSWQAEQTVTTSPSQPPQVVAATVYPAGPAGPFNIAAISMDQPTTTPRSFQLHIGNNIDPAGTVSAWQPAAQIGTPTTAPALGADLLVADLGAGTPAPDLLLIWTEQEPSGPQSTKFVIVPNIGSGASQPGAAATLAISPTGDFGIAGGLIGPAAPGAVDVVVWWISGSPGARTGQYVVGWQFGSAGPTSWSAPVPIPSPLPDTAVGLGAALTDIGATGLPDLVLYYVEQLASAPASPPEFRGRYLIGWDLGTDGVPAGGWSPPRDIPGDWTGTGSGGSAAVASLDPNRAADIAAIGAAFQPQANLLQQALLAPATLPDPPPGPPPFTASAVASTVLGALDPALTVPARLLSQIEVSGAQVAPPAPADPLATLAFTPTFPQPMYAPLRDLAPRLVLPSAQDIPPDTVTLMPTDPAFIESYLVGLNHEMSRLLAWRGYPASGAGTYFQYFWDRPPGSAAGPDIPPISAWSPTVPLGGNAALVGASGMLLLLIRGALPARWPGLIVRASRAVMPAGSTVPSPSDDWLGPVLTGRAEPDISYYAFELTGAQARSSPGPPADPGWFFVLSEQPFQPRFGLEPLPQPPVYGVAPATWGELTWGELATDAASYAAVAQISAANPPTALNNLTLGGVTFGHNAAHMASITLRQPFQVAIHADEMLRGLT